MSSDASAIVGTPDAPDVYLPSFASYNWIGSPSNYDLTTNAATGGDSNLENVNKWFQSGDQAYIIVASAMVSLARFPREISCWGSMVADMKLHRS